MVPFREFEHRHPNENFANFEKIMFVREPIERLVSAYQRLFTTVEDWCFSFFCQILFFNSGVLRDLSGLF